MAERAPRTQDEPEAPRDARGDAPLDAPPERSPASQSFPWASRLPLGWGSAPARPRRPSHPRPPPRRRPAE